MRLIDATRIFVLEVRLEGVTSAQLSPLGVH